MRVFTSLFARFKRNGVLAQNRQSLKHTLDCIETTKFIIALDLRTYLIDLTWSKHLIRNKIQSKFGFKCTYVFKRLSVGRPTVCNRGVVRWLEKCESKVRCHQISEAVLLWRWLIIKELSGKLKVKLNMLPCYGKLSYYFINFIYSVFNFSLHHLFEILWITNPEFVMSLWWARMAGYPTNKVLL